MSTYTPGARVFAVLNASEKQINLLGFGTYVGDEIPPSWNEHSEADITMAIDVIQEQDEDPLDVWPIYQQLVSEGEMTEQEAKEQFERGQEQAEQERQRPLVDRAKKLLTRLAHNPKIELDNGDVVWGYQCWWGAEEKWQEFLDRYNNPPVVEVRIQDVLAALESTP